MAHNVTVPSVGESITEGVLGQWLVDDGAWVDVDTPIYELETDKISTEVQAEVAGVLHHKVEAGAEIAIGATVAEIDTDAKPPEKTEAQQSDSKAADQQAPPPKEDAPERSAPPEKQSAKPEDPDTRSRPDHPAFGRGRIAPAALRLIEEHSLDPDSIAGSGKSGTVTKKDVLKVIEAQGKAPPSAPATGKTPSTPTPSTPAAPADRPGVRRRKLSPLRQKIAQRLVQVQRTAAILTTFNEIDMSACMALRSKYKDRFAEKHDTRLGFMSFFTRAATVALGDHPAINSFIDGDEVVEHDHVHMGIAIGTERGLVVPVLRDAQDMSFADIERAIRTYASKANKNQLSLSDLDGGTFTITNGGTYGSLMSTPIINPPQSGILGMHAIKDRPVAVDGEVVIRPMMYVALSYDHRIVDGAGAVGFLVRIKELIEEPERLLFDL